ncbi:hypothetical protein ACJX0J_027978, partial [Zea mays]
MAYFAFLILWHCHTTLPKRPYNIVLNRLSELITEYLDEVHIKNIWQQFWRVTSKIFLCLKYFLFPVFYMDRESTTRFLLKTRLRRRKVNIYKFVVVMHCYFSWNNVAAKCFEEFTHYLFYTILQGLGCAKCELNIFIYKSSMFIIT